MTNSLIVGCGNLGKNIVNGLIKEKKKFTIYDKNQKTLDILKKKKPEFCSFYKNLNKISFENYNYLFLCVKPKDVDLLLIKLKERIIKKNIIVSFVAGLSEEKIFSLIEKEVKVVRLMPNLLVRVGQSTTGAFSSRLERIEKEKIGSYISFFGKIIWLRKEVEMDFFTAFFGGGPAYISLFLKILTDILVNRGFQRKISEELVTSLVDGTNKLMKLESLSYSNLIGKVASKKGTTEQALNFLEKNNLLKNILTDAILCAEKRSVQLSKD